MSFTFDENNAGVEPIKPGEYEVYPNAYAVGTAKSGNQTIQLNHFIRDDVQQPGAGQEIKFDNFTVTPTAQWRFNALAKAAGTPQGFDFGSPEGWAQAMMGKAIRVVVEMEKDNKGKEWPRVRSFKPAQVPMNGQPVFKQNKQQDVTNAANNLNNQFDNRQQQNNGQNQQYGHPAAANDNPYPF